MFSPIDKHMQDILARCTAKSKAREKEKKPDANTTTVVYLPIWADSARGGPNSVLRSALFGATKRGKRAYLDAVEKYSVDGVTVIHTGPQLDQADLDVWEHCLHLARTSGLGVTIRFTGHDFLKSIGRATGKSQHEWLKASLRRLMTSLVELKDGHRVYAGQLIHHWTRDEETLRHVIVINPKIASMYGADGWTQIEWAQRQALQGHPIAQWLHGFYSTHAAPFPYSVSKLHQLCGSEAEQLFHFRARLREAMDRVAEVTGWTWSIDAAGLLHIQKIPTPTQARHLTRKSHGKKTTQR